MGLLHKLVCAGALWALMGMGAQAAEVKYAFSVRVDEIDQFTNYELSGQFASVAYPRGGQFSVGDVLTGTFSFDQSRLDLPPANQSATSRYFVDTLGGAHDLSFVAPGGVSYSSPKSGGAGILQLGHSAGSDYFAIGDYGWNLHASFVVANWQGGAFHSLDLPADMKLADLPYTWFSVGWPTGQDQQISVIGSVVSLTPLSAVPEPDAWSTLLVGLVGLACLRKRLAAERT
jgi:hypothetical protein